jgi:hypothetical protein
VVTEEGLSCVGVTEEAAVSIGMGVGVEVTGTEVSISTPLVGVGVGVAVIVLEGGEMSTGSGGGGDADVPTGGGLDASAVALGKGLPNVLEGGGLMSRLGSPPAGGKRPGASAFTAGGLAAEVELAPLE